MLSYMDEKEPCQVSPKGQPRKHRSALPAPAMSSRLLLRMGSKDVGMFRFLLEAYDNLALFTVLERRPALLKLSYSPHQEEQVKQALEDILRTVPLEILPWPRPRQLISSPTEEQTKSL